MIATETATTVIAQMKAAGTRIVLTLTDGSIVIGDPISVNSKGINLKDARDGKVITRALSKVTVIEDEATYLARTEETDDVLGAYGDPDPADDDDTDYSDEDELSEEDEDEDDAEAEDNADDDLHEGMTTAEVAAIFDMPAKDLRKVTRAMGLGVGRGRVYSFDEDDVTKIRKELKVRAAAEATDTNA